MAASRPLLVVGGAAAFVVMMLVYGMLAEGGWLRWSVPRSQTGIRNWLRFAELEDIWKVGDRAASGERRSIADLVWIATETGEGPSQAVCDRIDVVAQRWPTELMTEVARLPMSKRRKVLLLIARAVVDNDVPASRAHYVIDASRLPSQTKVMLRKDLASVLQEFRP